MLTIRRGRDPVDEPREQRAREQVGQEDEREGERGEKRRAGAPEHDHRQGDGRDAAARDREIAWAVKSALNWLEPSASP